METELKEGDVAELRGKVVEIEDFHLSFSRALHLEVETSNGKKRVSIIEDECKILRKVRPGTYEVTARDVAEIMFTFEDDAGRWPLPRHYYGENEHDEFMSDLTDWWESRLLELKRKEKQ